VIVVDTDVVSFVYKGDSRFIRAGELIRRQGGAISFMTLAETDRWALGRDWSRQRAEQFAEYLKTYDVVWPNRRICLAWAGIKESSRTKGRTIDHNDAWIAATALILECPLLTNNARHFADIDGLDIWNP
jgi:predicted nucleic acid-binding protein